MARSFISALEMLMSLQRWNFLPRVETWTEAENAAYVAHMAYAIAKEMGEDDVFIQHLLLRVLLQSMRKYEISDIPKHTVDVLKEIKVKETKQEEDYYIRLVNDAAKKTVDLFPRPIGGQLESYFKEEPEFIDKETAQRIDNLFNYCKRKAALQECLTNKLVYNDAEGYEERKQEIENRILETPNNKLYGDIFDNYKAYFSTVRNLKYLRRWNRINRNIETSVLAHTYVVALLALVYALNEEMIFLPLYDRKYTVEGPLQIRSILLAMFHDILESLTGDVITPVKKKINELASQSGEPNLWDKVEEEHKKIIKKKMPPSILKEAERYELLDELSLKKPYTVSSFVKQCDMLALIIECVFELKANPSIQEMKATYSSYVDKLKNSEWISIRQLMNELVVEYPSFSGMGNG